MVLSRAERRGLRLVGFAAFSAIRFYTEPGSELDLNIFIRTEYSLQILILTFQHYPTNLEWGIDTRSHDSMIGMPFVSH